MTACLAIKPIEVSAFLFGSTPSQRTMALRTLLLNKRKHYQNSHNSLIKPRSLIKQKMKTVNSRTPLQILGGTAFRSLRKLTLLKIYICGNFSPLPRRERQRNKRQYFTRTKGVEGVLVVAEVVSCYGRVLSQK